MGVGAKADEQQHSAAADTGVSDVTNNMDTGKRGRESELESRRRVESSGSGGRQNASGNGKLLVL